MSTSTTRRLTAAALAALVTLGVAAGTSFAADDHDHDHDHDHSHDHSHGAASATPTYTG